MTAMAIIGDARDGVTPGLPRFDDGMVNVGELARTLAESIVNEVMDVEADLECEGGNQRNGYRERRIMTVIGEVTLRIPRLREGSYFPEEVLRPYSRTDRAMVAAIAEAYKLGLSTRKIERAAADLEFGRLSPSAISRMCATLDGDVAAVIVEPVAGNMNLVSPRPEFLQSLRTQCTKYGSVLIFDEVMTGFRVGPGCAQGLYSITPDLTTLGKVIGGGMPVAAFGGKREIMEKIAPLGPVYQAGTLSGNPVAVAAGLATLKLIQKPGFFLELERKTEALCEGLNAAAVNNGIAFSAQSVGGMFGLYFRAHWPRNFAEVMQCNKDAFNRFFHAMLDAGHYFAPSAFEAGFVSAAHAEADIDSTIAAAEQWFAANAG